MSEKTMRNSLPLLQEEKKRRHSWFEAGLELDPELTHVAYP